ncbi:MAG TPA: lipopolysaccharide heptosyltransferase II [Gammaproteobacteria bacterium]|jgi:heptosyltransferase-2|nr:lipopolysaccharide heptosyltransferase II [Gammaproteobacteria bacterium]
MSSQQKKILIVGPSWVGDMVMAQGLFKLIKANHPDVILDVLAPAWTFSVLGAMPEISTAIEMPIGHGELKLLERFRIGRKLRSTQYDQAIVLPNSFKSALIPFFADIPLRTGWLGEARYLLLNDYRKLDKTRYPLMIEQYLALGLPKDAALPKPYPYPAFYVSKEAQDAALAKYQPRQSGDKILALGAGAEFGPSKRWPLEYFAELANRKLEEGYDVWLFGSPKDRPITDKIMELTNQRCENLAGRLQLSETIALLSLVSGAVTNDSGLMHMAAALKKPLIAVYGSTSPRFTPPLSEQAVILQLNLDCQPCFERDCPLKHHRCMRDITPEHVADAMNTWSQ